MYPNEWLEMPGALLRSCGSLALALEALEIGKDEAEMGWDPSKRCPSSYANGPLW